MDFDEAWLSEESCGRMLEVDEFEVAKIINVRSGRRTRYGRVQHQYQMLWNGHDERTWVDEKDRNCRALL